MGGAPARALLGRQLAPKAFEVIVDMGRVRRSAEGYYIHSKELFTEGVIWPAALPGVTIEIARLSQWN